MWPDIEKVSLFENLPAAVQRLSRTVERFAASRFFAGHWPIDWGIYKVGDSKKLQILSWLNWASILALPGAVTGDPLHRDLTEIALGNEWLESQEKRDICEDPLLAVLFELRNYEVHIELRTGKIGNFSSKVMSDAKTNGEPKEVDFGDTTFISPIDFGSLSQLRNIQSGRSPVTAEMVNWFNRQAIIWPAAYLIGTARERYVEYIAHFLERNGFE